MPRPINILLIVNIVTALNFFKDEPLHRNAVVRHFFANPEAHWDDWRFVEHVGGDSDELGQVCAVDIVPARFVEDVVRKN
jgi:hypothetical protein